MYRVQLQQHDQIGSILIEMFEWLSLLPIAGRWHLLQFRAKLSRQFAEGGRTRPLCEIAAVQMKSGKVLVEAFEESN